MMFKAEALEMTGRNSARGSYDSLAGAVRVWRMPPSARLNEIASLNPLKRI
jgi:hypothetical protein